MDFIEELFGVGLPDGGSGATEFMLLVAVAAAIFVGVLRNQPEFACAGPRPLGRPRTPS